MKLAMSKTREQFPLSVRKIYKKHSQALLNGSVLPLFPSFLWLSPLLQFMIKQ